MWQQTVIHIFADDLSAVVKNNGRESAWLIVYFDKVCEPALN